MESEINIRSLKIITNAILDHLIDELHLEKIKLKQDDYWDVPVEQIYDLQKDPTIFNVGRLADDWEFLSHILKDNKQAVAYMLVHLSPILRSIGEEIGE